MRFEFGADKNCEHRKYRSAARALRRGELACQLDGLQAANGNTW